MFFHVNYVKPEPYWREVKIDMNTKEATTPHTGEKCQCTGERPYNLKKAIIGTEKFLE